MGPPVTGFLLALAFVDALLAVHAAVNVRFFLRRPPSDPPVVDVPVSVLVPARDEADRIEACLRALLAQVGVPRLEVVVLDDGSTDGTAGVAESIGVRVLAGSPPPAGWLGKPHACRQLAEAATGEVLVFVDADVVLGPRAVAAGVALLDGFDLVSPWPRQVAVGWGERLVQPLQQWSWLSTLPLRLAERSRRPSLSAANGQFLVFRRAAYDRAGGHAAVRAAVLDDIGMARAVKRSGGRVAVADGSGIAACRMYPTWRALVDGYTKSLWAAFGSPLGAGAVVATLIGLYVVPPAAVGWWPGLAGYLAGVAGRVVCARATGGRWWPDALLHPLSVLVFGWLTGLSLIRRRRGQLRWKSRRLAP